MPKVVEYLIVKTYTAEELILAVNEKVDEGWQPHGSVAFLSTESQFVFAQAIVKYEIPKMLGGAEELRKAI